MNMVNIKKAVSTIVYLLKCENIEQCFFFMTVKI